MIVWRRQVVCEIDRFAERVDRRLALLGKSRADLAAGLGVTTVWVSVLLRFGRPMREASFRKLEMQLRCHDGSLPEWTDWQERLPKNTSAAPRVTRKRLAGVRELARKLAKEG